MKSSVPFLSVAHMLYAPFPKFLLADSTTSVVVSFSFKGLYSHCLKSTRYVEEPNKLRATDRSSIDKVHDLSLDKPEVYRGS